MIYKIVQSFYKNWLLVLKITWGIWTTSHRQWKIQSWNLMGYVCPKSTFLQLEHYILKIYLTLLSTTCMKILQTTCVIFETIYIYKSFFTTQLLSIFLLKHYILSTKVAHQSANFHFPLLGLRLTNFVMSFFKQKASFSSKFGSFFSVMRDNSSVLF